MQIEAIGLKNFYALKDVTLRDIPRFCMQGRIAAMPGASENLRCE